MKKFNEHLHAEAQHIRLTDEEKRSMRLVLNERIKLQPLQRAAPRHRLAWIALSRFAVPALAVLLLCAGTTYAAQGALPGDVLYPIKIHINERAEVALAKTPQAKAGVEERLAGRRVAEAQTLAARGELTATTTQELQDNFNVHASEAIALVQEVRPQRKHASTTAASTTEAPKAKTAATRGEREEKDTLSELETSLGVQADILEHLKSELNARQKNTHRDDKKPREEKHDDPNLHIGPGEEILP